MKIICIGRNYTEHAKELNNAVPTEPVFFLKPDTAILKNNSDFYIPDFTSDLHYETEIVLKINRVGKHIDEKFASRYFDEIGIGIDFTARDLQQKAKEKGLPWEIAKAFDYSAPLGEFMHKLELPDVNAINFGLQLNKNWVQTGNTRDMIFSFEKIIAYISKYITLKIGDLIFTGTPAGVGSVKIGDTLEASIEGKNRLTINIK